MVIENEDLTGGTQHIGTLRMGVMKALNAANHTEE